MPKFGSQIDTQKIPFKSPVMENATSNPSSPVEGQVFWNSTTNILYVYDGSGWVTFYPSTTPLSSMTAPAADLAMNSFKITGLAAPTATSDAATKGYVDGAIQGVDQKESCKYGSIADQGIATNPVNGISATSQWGPGLSVADFPVNTRLLVAGETTNPKNNGIYVVWQNTGSTYSFQRATDMDAWTEVPGAFVFVEKGTMADTGWVSTADQGGTLNTTAITWTQFSSVGSYSDGAGLSLAGLSFSVNVDGTSIEINSDTLRVKAAGVTNAMLAGSIDLTTKVAGALALANGGTGATSAAAARANLVTNGIFETVNPTMVSGAYSSNITHGLGAYPKSVLFINISTGEAEIWDWKYIDGNNVQIKTDMGVTASTYKVEVAA